jgi:hypothetical protein
MNMSTHPVAAEEVMAFLDGELSAADAQAVFTHINRCAECSVLVEQFRGTSQSLSTWKVPAVPSKVGDSVADFAAKFRSGLKIGKPYIFIRAGFWTWKEWAIGSGATAAALLLVLAISIPNLHRFPGGLVATKAIHPVGERTERAGSIGGSRGSFGKLTIDGPPISDQQSKVFTNQVPLQPMDRIVTLNEPGIAADSNGLFHGLGDHDKGSFSVNGQPGIGQLDGKVISGPMIARTVSLSMVVKDFPASRATLDILLARHHGYSAQLTVSTPENAARGLQASLRIPAPELSSAVADLKTLGRVENESQSGEEVTQQHTDLVARLKTSRETEQRFRTILQQRTGNAVEVLQVEEGIARVRGDIERMEAEQKALEHRVDFAAVELQLSEEYKAQLNPPAASVSTRIHNSLVAGYRNAAETILGIVLFFAEDGPTLFLWLVILASPVFLIWRRYRRTLATV